MIAQSIVRHSAGAPVRTGDRLAKRHDIIVVFALSARCVMMEEQSAQVMRSEVLHPIAN